MNIKEEILKMSEPQYQQFNAKLLPGVENIQGVRLGNLRKLAKKIVKDDWQTFLQKAETDFFEEIMLYGMVIGYLKTDTVEEIFPYMDTYISMIDNWSTCDSFCSGLKITKEYPEKMWSYLQSYFKSDKEFYIRFAVVMGLNYYINDEYKDRFLKQLDKIHHEGYYVKMAVAWAISMIYVSYPDETTKYLKSNNLDDFTHNKAIQKIKESNQVTKEVKQKLNDLKRK